MTLTNTRCSFDDQVVLVVNHLVGGRFGNLHRNIASSQQIRGGHSRGEAGLVGQNSGKENGGAEMKLHLSTVGFRWLLYFCS